MAKKAEPKEEIIKQTVIIIPEDDDIATISTYNRKWINKLLKLEEEGHATEVEASEEDAREFELDKSMIRIPFYREPRVYTEEQREAARERLVGVREAVQASKKKLAKKAGKGKAAPAPAPKGKPGKPAKKAKVLEPEPEDEIDDEDEDVDDEIEDEIEDEEPEVVVKRPASKKPVSKGKPVKKGKK